MIKLKCCDSCEKDIVYINFLYDSKNGNARVGKICNSCKHKKEIKRIEKFRKKETDKRRQKRQDELNSGTRTICSKCKNAHITENMKIYRDNNICNKCLSLAIQSSSEITNSREDVIKVRELNISRSIQDKALFEKKEQDMIKNFMKEIK